MEELTLARYEAQGNDFLIALLTEAELRSLDASLNARGLGRSDLASVVCNRSLGLGTQRGYVHSRGADGLILAEVFGTTGQAVCGERAIAAQRGAEQHNAPEDAPRAPIRMHLRNADGSVAETSGNGLACLAMASFDARIIGAGPLIPFDTDAGEQRCTVANAGGAQLAGPTTPIPSDDVAQRRSVEVAMNPVGPGPEIPDELEERIRSTFGGDLRHFGTGDIGNPHLVIALAKPPINCPSCELNDRAEELAAAVSKLGSIYQTYFPDGINVEFIWPYPPNPTRPEQAWTLQMSVWERGAGLTVSCGSGSVVAATLARHWGFVRNPAEVPEADETLGQNQTTGSHTVTGAGGTANAAKPSHNGPNRKDPSNTYGSDPLGTAPTGRTDANRPSTYLIDMRTAPYPGSGDTIFRYSVRTVPYLEQLHRPQLCVEAVRIETDLTLRLNDVPALLPIASQQ